MSETIEAVPVSHSVFATWIADLKKSGRTVTTVREDGKGTVYYVNEERYGKRAIGHIGDGQYLYLAIKH